MFIDIRSKLITEGYVVMISCDEHIEYILCNNLLQYPSLYMTHEWSFFYL